MKLSVRTLMALVLLTGIVLHLSAAVWRVHRTVTPHLHTAIVPNRGNPGKATLIQQEPFWPAFLRQATGINRGAGCFMGGECLLEMCELAHPEIRMPTATNVYAPIFTREQLQLLDRLNQVEKRPKKDGWEWVRRLVRK